MAKSAKKKTVKPSAPRSTKTSAKKAEMRPAAKSAAAVAAPVKSAVGPRTTKPSQAAEIRLAVTTPVRATPIAVARAKQAAPFKRAFPHSADKE